MPPSWASGDISALKHLSSLALRVFFRPRFYYPLSYLLLFLHRGSGPPGGIREACLGRTGAFLYYSCDTRLYLDLSSNRLFPLA